MVLAALAAGCGSSTAGGGRVPGGTLTIYSSLPLQGPNREVSDAILKGEKLALKERQGSVGDWKISFVSLDDTRDQTGWDPGVTSSNARQAAQDQTTIAYVGDLDSGATAISLPILNSAGILQVSPGSTLPALTVAQASERGSPEKFYPSGKRNFGRIVPNDVFQGDVLVRYMRDQGVKRLYLLSDTGPYGEGLAGEVEASVARLAAYYASPGERIEIVGQDTVRRMAQSYADLAAKVAQSGADAVFFGGDTADGAVQLWHDLHAAAPGMSLFGGDALAEPAFTGAIDTGAAARTFLTAPGFAEGRGPAAARQFERAYRAAYGSDPGFYGVYGYEAMRVVLDAIAAAGPRASDRQSVISALFKMRDRQSPLGTYSFDPNGDVSLRTYTGYRVRDRGLVFDRQLAAPATVPVAVPAG